MLLLLSFVAPCIDQHPDKYPGWAATGQCKKIGNTWKKIAGEAAHDARMLFWFHLVVCLSARFPGVTEEKPDGFLEIMRINQGQ